MTNREGWRWWLSLQGQAGGTVGFSCQLWVFSEQNNFGSLLLVQWAKEANEHLAEPHVTSQLKALRYSTTSLKAIGRKIISFTDLLPLYKKTRQRKNNTQESIQSFFPQLSLQHKQRHVPELLYSKHRLFLFGEYCDYLNITNLGWACTQFFKKKIASLLSNVFIPLSSQFPHNLRFAESSTMLSSIIHNYSRDDHLDTSTSIL